MLIGIPFTPTTVHNPFSFALSTPAILLILPFGNIPPSYINFQNIFMLILHIFVIRTVVGATFETEKVRLNRWLFMIVRPVVRTSHSLKIIA